MGSGVSNVNCKKIKGVGKYGRRFVWEEEITDPDILSYHFQERAT